MKIFKLNLPLYLVVFLLLGAFAGGKFIPLGNNLPESTEPIVLNSCPSWMEQVRLQSYKYTHPLLLADVSGENEKIKSIQSKISEYVNLAKSNQKADDISIYFRKLDDGSWFSLNSNATYNPASMIKIAYLITYLKMAEINPQILNTKIFFARHQSSMMNPNIKDVKLKEGNSYTVKELLYAMIVYSDNDATLLIAENMNTKIYFDLFTDLNLTKPNPVAEYYISVSDYCKFFRVLYNASYVSPEFSEYALNLLTQSTYALGLKKGIDANVTIAHKFGERVIGNKAQLHECGIVFYGNSPYLIGVMTMGNSLPQLGDIVSDISKIAFDEYKGMPNL